MLPRFVFIYKTNAGLEPFIEWLEKLDKRTQIKIRKRISRIEMGNFGDYKFLGSGVYELRFFFDSGYRVYFGVYDNVIFLLCGGDKSSQRKDIKNAVHYWKEVQK
jgi:putative addiction module killer protein